MPKVELKIDSNAVQLTDNAEVYIFSTEGNMLFNSPKTNSITIQNAWKDKNLYVVINGNVQQIKF